MTAECTCTEMTPVLLRSRNYQWYYNAMDVSSTTDDKELWQPYTEIENEIIEDAFKEKKFHVEIDGDYGINLDFLLQYRKDDEFTTVRPIKRIQRSKDQTLYYRVERFSSPFTADTSISCHQSPYRDDEPKYARKGTNFASTYQDLELRQKSKTLADVVEDASEGIAGEGTAIGKAQEAQWLAKELIKVKHYGANVEASTYSGTVGIPAEIGEMCVRLYTEDSFWYRLINLILRTPANWSRTQIKRLGPFCWLLNHYLCENKTSHIETVYRSLNLTDEKRHEFTQGTIMFTSFISTTRKREFAEFLGGNTLLVMDLKDDRETVRSCGVDITPLSNFPEEEEFLMWPGGRFNVVSNIYVAETKKHIIHLKPSMYGIV